MQSVFGKKLFWKRFLFQCDQALLTNSCLILRHCIENSRFTGHESVCLGKCSTKLQILFASTHNGNYSTYLCSERKISMSKKLSFLLLLLKVDLWPSKRILKLLRLFEGNKFSHCGANRHKRVPDKNHCSTKLEENTGSSQYIAEQHKDM